MSFKKSLALWFRMIYPTISRGSSLKYSECFCLYLGVTRRVDYEKSYHFYWFNIIKNYFHGRGRQGEVGDFTLNVTLKLSTSPSLTSPQSVPWNSIMYHQFVVRATFKLYTTLFYFHKSLFQIDRYSLFNLFSVKKEQ